MILAELVLQQRKTTMAVTKLDPDKVKKAVQAIVPKLTGLASHAYDAFASCQ